MNESSNTLTQRIAGSVAAAILATVIAVGASSHTADALTNVIAEWSGSTLLGNAQNAPHRWGVCDVQDYNGGAWGWYIRIGRPGTTDNFHVRHGMLAGYTAVGGPTGYLACPLSDEYGYAGGARQNFQGGVLYWRPGMSRAQVTSYRMADAIGFATRFVGQWGGEACKAAGLGSGGYVGGYSGGQCKQFVNCVMWKVARINPAYGYAATGARRIWDVNAVRPGDIIQTSSPHTAIVIRVIGGGQFEVVDSNWSLNERVQTHLWTPPTTAEYWRY